MTTLSGDHGQESRAALTETNRETRRQVIGLRAGDLSCPRCGRIARRKAMRGRTAPFANMAALPVPDSVPLPTCLGCGFEWPDERAQGILRSALKDAYEAELKARVRELIELLTQPAKPHLAYISQEGLQKLLHLSAGYLSRLYHGRGRPSAALVSLLALLAENPQPRLAALQDFWGAPPERRTAKRRARKEEGGTDAAT